MQPATAFDFHAPPRFELRSRVGRGAVGVVYEAFDHERSSRVALKVLHTRDPEALLSLKKEFRAVQDIQHPNLVHVGELFEESGSWFFTMEFVDGTPFVQYVRPHDPKAKASVPTPVAAPLTGPVPSGFDEPRLRASLVQLVRGIMALHDAGIVHRDVKPPNILVTDEGRVVLLDFGVSSDLLRGEESDHGMVGTIAYMAPEQAMSEASGPAADWYAVGVVLYQALAGRLPFYGSMHEVLAQKVAREPPPPSAITPDVPRDLDQLCAALLRLPPSARPDGRAILTMLGATERIEGASSGPHPAAAVFVGRARELTDLEEAYADTLRGRAVTLFVHGESGVGKSFLVRRFLTELRERDHETLVLAGRCFERESVPYKAVDGVVDQLSSHLAALDEAERRELLPEHAALFVRAFPVLGRAIRTRASEHTDVVNPQELRARLFGGMRTLFARLAVRSPVVVAIDDLQWADRDSLTLLTEITRAPDAPPILLVVTMRIATERVPTGTYREMAGLDEAEDVRHLEIEQLPRDEARALAARLLGEERADPAAVDAIVEEANGHPLFIDELVRQRNSVQRVKLLKLDDALWSRVSRLDPQARRLLELVAVAGLPIAQGVAADAAALDLGQLFDLASVLRSAHFAKTGGTRREDKIEPYHDRVRESVLAHLDADVRARWHARLATALERSESADPEALATHWHAAGNVHRAAEYAEKAADAAMQTLAFERAARLYRFALEMNQHPPDTARDLKRRLAEALTNAGYVSDAAEVRLALAKEVGHDAALDLRRRAAEQLLNSGRFDTGLEVLRAVLDAAGIYFPRSPLAVIFSVLVARLVLLARGVSFKPRRASEVSAAELARADAAWAAGSGFSMTDNIRGAYFQTRNLLASLRIGDPERVSRALAMEVCFRSAGGSATHAQAAALLAREWEIATEVNTAESLAMANTATGYVHYMVGNWAEAQLALVNAEELFRDRCVGSTFQLNSARTMLYRVLAYRGDLKELAARVPAVLREVEQRSDHYAIVNLQAGPMTLLALADDAPDRVRDALGAVGERLPKGAFLVQHYFAVMAQCQLDLYGGDGTAALARLGATWPALRRSLLLRVQAITIMSLEQRARAALAAFFAAGGSRGGSSRPPGAPREDLLAVAEADARKLGHVRLDWAAASAAMLRGSIAAARGNRDQALALLDDAGRRFDAMGMVLYAAACRRRAGELRGGEEGDAVCSADERMRERGVKRPDRMVAIFSPPVRRG
jgi:hypothetical protein